MHAILNPAFGILPPDELIRFCNTHQIQINPCGEEQQPDMWTRLLARVSSASHSIWWCLIWVAIALVAAILGGAVLISDGAYFLYQTVNSQSVEVPHLRITFAMLLYPAVIATYLTENFTIIRWIYSIPLVIAPLVTLALSWWVVRRTRPSLFVWAAFGILLVNLPGQMHWVATSIRTNQLFWPLLLAILIGMPSRVVPMAIVLAQLMMVLHPHAAAYFLAGTLVSLWLAWRHPDIRDRMLATAGIGAFYASFRFLIPSTGYESDVSGLTYQVSLFERAVVNYAGLGLLFTALTATLIAISPRLQTTANWFRWAPYVSLTLAGAMFVIWGLDGEVWRRVTDYRGSNLLFSLLLMGLAFLDAIIKPDKANQPDLSNVRKRLAGLAAIIFCITISIQSTVLAIEINRIQTIIDQAGPGCIRESEIPDFSSSVLFHTTFPSISIMLQSRTPDRIVLPDHICDEIAEAGTGNIPVFRTPDGSRFSSGWIDMWPLQYSVAGNGQCWVGFSDGWHSRERSGDGTWGRWSRNIGTVRLAVSEPQSVIFSADFRTFIPDSTLTFVINGEEVKTIELSDEFQTILPITLNLEAGDNWLEMYSNQEPRNPPENPQSLSQDPRTMTFMIWNPAFRYDLGASECIIR